MTTYCFSLFDLVGLLRYTTDGEDVVHTIAPCLIETHLEEVDGCVRPLNLLVDGLHRCITATRNGVVRLRVLRAQSVQYPLIARPVTWNRVSEYVYTPPESQKRIYRYTKVADMPAEVHRLTNGAVTDSNCRTFFFRDLDALGSLGQRLPYDSTHVQPY